MIKKYKTRVRIWLTGIAASGLICLVGAGSPAEAAKPAAAGVLPVNTLRYDRDIRPILSDRCFTCHGADANKRRAELRLDVGAEATAAHKHGAPIVPGKVEESELLKRIEAADADEVMPPPKAGKRPLSIDEKDMLRRWIAEGAAYEQHWSFVKPKRPAPPAIGGAPARNPIDAFIRAELQPQGLDLSAPADKHTLIRRLFLDLTGLPPTPEELEAFAADARPDAYEQWVDKLLTTEPYRTRYAERMAVPWLDEARYADTSGIHMDAGRSIWAYRDWVLHAYRTNMPFDRFVIEQLAGDLLPNATQSQKVASGFHRNHVTSDEGGAINEEYLVEYAVDRVSTTGSVFLGLTLGCARCHDHKYDPVTMNDFYSLFAFFDSNEEPGIYSQVPDNKRALEPFMSVPTPEQEAQQRQLDERLAAAKTEQTKPVPEEDALRTQFLADMRKQAGVGWIETLPIAAKSTGGADLTIQPDHSVLASGKNPDSDVHELTLRVAGTNLRTLLLEALGDSSLFQGRVGRAPNGNAVLSGFECQAVSLADPSRAQVVDFRWAWADVEQDNGDFRLLGLFDAKEPGRGWAVDAHRTPGTRAALFVAETPFGFDGGTELRIKLRYETQFAQHTFGRVRLTAGRMSDEGFALLPDTAGSWYQVGPFPADLPTVYDHDFGPETDGKLDFARNFGAGNQMWRYAPQIADQKLVPLPEGTSAFYIGRELDLPTPRKILVSLGSDDGIRVWANGVEIFGRRVDRGLKADQDRTEISLNAGRNTLVFKIVNTGGPGGFFYREIDPEGVAAPIVAALLPEAARTPERETRLVAAWRTKFSPRFRELSEQIGALEKEQAALLEQIPKTMVMAELPKPRPTFVLTRGQYDHADPNRPVQRAIPAALGTLTSDAPQNRLGLAQWLISTENPLTARVTVNRFWELFFGRGLVRTSEDFGMQGEWPSHPELLDWLAVEFRESGWDVQHMVRLIVTSDTYRQDSRVRPAAVAKDPENHLLAYYPRQRLGAEQLRDQALYVSGLLVEKLGGPSVKPYQPPGLWEEVAMPQSNTRIFEMGKGEDLWRRSVYTYWKRACPPPSLLTLDAPTREFCTIRRTVTNTPLQALVLWNDEQFVEAARNLAARTLTLPGADAEHPLSDAARLTNLAERCFGRTLQPRELQTLTAALGEFRSRFKETPDDAGGILKLGQSPLPENMEKSELAAWTLVANAVLSADSAVSKD